MNAILAPAPQLATQRRIGLIVIHCSATPSGRWLQGAPGTPGAARAVEVIDGWHAQRGFKRDAAARKRFNAPLGYIGYHYVIDLDGDVAPGRSLGEVGAHVAGHNAHSVGICLVGGAERDARYTLAQWVALGRLVYGLCQQIDVPCVLPTQPRSGAGVCGHRDLSPDADGDGAITRADWLKTCPGFDVGGWLARGLKPQPEQLVEMQP